MRPRSIPRSPQSRHGVPVVAPDGTRYRSSPGRCRNTRRTDGGGVDDAGGGEQERTRRVAGGGIGRPRRAHPSRASRRLPLVRQHPLHRPQARAAVLPRSGRRARGHPREDPPRWAAGPAHDARVRRRRVRGCRSLRLRARARRPLQRGHHLVRRPGATAAGIERLLRTFRFTDSANRPPSSPASDTLVQQPDVSLIGRSANSVLVVRRAAEMLPTLPEWAGLTLPGGELWRADRVLEGVKAGWSPAARTVGAMSSPAHARHGPRAARPRVRPRPAAAGRDAGRRRVVGADRRWAA